MRFDRRLARRPRRQQRRPRRQQRRQQQQAAGVGVGVGVRAVHRGEAQHSAAAGEEGLHAR